MRSTSPLGWEPVLLSGIRELRIHPRKEDPPSSASRAHRTAPGTHPHHRIETFVVFVPLVVRNGFKVVRKKAASERPNLKPESIHEGKARTRPGPAPETGGTTSGRPHQQPSSRIAPFPTPGEGRSDGREFARRSGRVRIGEQPPQSPAHMPRKRRAWQPRTGATKAPARWTRAERQLPT